MKILSNSIKIILLTSILDVSFVHGQKLPKVQKKSIYAPADIKIDGKSPEWNDNFQAYNKAVEILYTMSNDSNNLYLTAKVKQKEIIDKLIRGGITLIINREPDEKSKNFLAVTYPALEGPPMWELANKFLSLSNANKNHEAFNVNQLNEMFAKREKLISVAGIKEVPDNSLSIYNSEGIQVAALFDNQLYYTYELAIPIKYFKISSNSVSTFNYQIKLNPAPEIKRPAVITPDLPPPPPPVMEGTMATTDFKGKYTLANRP
ncbi:hypothetical protein MUGA111182_17675 [Mucilaginibacter galii]|uniref:Uncharacterized protein n=1 Tax=Mucilaginibacter galii TaxID=2005073 RepID=A0A917N2T4_9SPHI|nr:hypothetical protein [Mucilaginibacter galii]GGI52266.1 hypothetical protein GCM10011425_34780 [Mucilaginibacter galii]